jgi:lysophospholipase L1-like esterase
MRSVDERAATMSFPLDTAYMQVLPQPSGIHTVLVTMPMSDLRALLKELPETHFQVPHISEIRSHPFKVPLPAVIMERLSPAVEDIYKTVRIACIGDSITACNYPAHLQKMFDKADIRVQVRNFGVAGATVQRFSDQPFWDEKKKEDARQWRPHFAIFTFGSNDAKENNWDLEAFEQDYRDLVKEYLECMHPRPVVSLVTPPPLYEEDAYDMQQSVINSVLPEVIPRVSQAAEEVIMKPIREECARCRVECPEELVAHTDVIDAFSSFGGAELRRRGYIADDGVHPNERGTKLLTYIVFAHIRRQVVSILAKWRDAPKVVDDSGMF